MDPREPAHPVAHCVAEEGGGQHPLPPDRGEAAAVEGVLAAKPGVRRPEAALRLAGGSAALFHTQTLAFAWCTPEADGRTGIRARFARTAEWIAAALRALGVDARVGEVPGAYCPGDFSVNARGRRKLMGVGQRIVRGAVHTGGVLVVADSERVRRVLTPVYAALDYPYDPATTGSVADELGSVALDDVREALLAQLARHRELRDGALGTATLEQAARFEDSHRIPEP